MTVEELETRAQPALLGLVSVPGLVGLELGGNAPAAGAPASFAANGHALGVTFHVQPGGSNVSTDTPAAPVTLTPTGGAPSASVTPAIPSQSPTPTTTTAGTAFNFAAANAAGQLPPSATPTATGSPATAFAPIFLPPSVTAPALAPAALPASSAGSPVERPATAGGAVAFAGAGSVPYLSGETPVALPLFDAAGIPVAAVAANQRPAGAIPAQASHRLDRAADVPAEFALPVAQPVPVANEAVPPVPLAEVSAETPVVEAGGAGASPWTWAAVAVGAVGAAAWGARRYWLKPAAARPDDRSWRNYLLGLDFDRL